MSTRTESNISESGLDEGLVLVLNCGSSSIKFALYDAAEHPLPKRPMWSGKAVDIGGPNVTYEDTDTPCGPLRTEGSASVWASVGSSVWHTVSCMAAPSIPIRCAWMPRCWLT